MNPAIYFTASCLSILGLFGAKPNSEINSHDVQSRSIMSADRIINTTCLCIIVVSLVVPPFVHLIRSRLRMRDFDVATRPIKDRLGSSMEKTVLFPIDSGYRRQLSSAIKLLQVSHGQHFSVKIVRPEACEGIIASSESYPDFGYCSE